MHYGDDVTNVRPLVVMDLVNAEQTVKTLRIKANGSGMFQAGVLCELADQIEAQTKPPRIPEPGLWGVVEASSTLLPVARRWVRHTGPSTCWRDAFGNSAVWDSLIDPTLVREGVTK